MIIGTPIRVETHAISRRPHSRLRAKLRRLESGIRSPSNALPPACLLLTVPLRPIDGGSASVAAANVRVARQSITNHGPSTGVRDEGRWQAFLPIITTSILHRLLNRPHPVSFAVFESNDLCSVCRALALKNPLYVAPIPLFRYKLLFLMPSARVRLVHCSPFPSYFPHVCYRSDYARHVVSMSR